ncbi:MAG: glycosyltransferase [Saprospiraceae bacterium]
MKNPEAKLSICVMTYNHNNYIEQCLFGIVNQKTRFPIKVVIGDDISNDGTTEKCKKIENDYPDIVEHYISSGSKNPTIESAENNLKEKLKYCSGEYIAICEGDDYWTDLYKLQKQVDFLDTHPEAAGCFTDATTVNENGSLLTTQYYSADQDYYSQKDCLKKLRSSYATCTLVFRKSVLDGEWPLWLHSKLCDEFLDLHITSKGLLAYLPDNTAAYRIHSRGIWQGNSSIWRNKEMIGRYEMLISDDHMKEKYEDILTEYIVKHIQSLLSDQGCSIIDAHRYFIKLIRYYPIKQMSDILKCLDFYFIGTVRFSPIKLFLNVNSRKIT